MIPRGLFITGTGTGVGKSWVTRGLVRGANRSGGRWLAVKPIETGCEPDPLDAQSLARACGHPALADTQGFHRSRLPLAPYAAALEGDGPAIDFDALVDACAELAKDADGLLVEGAGGLLVPLDASRTMADLALALDYPILLVAQDTLGVLSHVLTTVESAQSRALPIAGVVLTRPTDAPDDPSRRTNQRILEERLGVPLFLFLACPDDDDALADTADQAGLLTLLR